MKTDIDNIARQAGELAAMHAQCQATEKRILELAQNALAKIEAKLPELQRKAITDDSASAEYMHLVKEKGRLVVIISQAENNLK